MNFPKLNLLLAVAVLAGCAAPKPAPVEERRTARPTPSTLRPLVVECERASGDYLARVEQRVAQNSGSAAELAELKYIMWTVRTKCPSY